jgi:putative protease
MTVNVKNRFEQGDTLELITPAGNATFDLAAMENKHGESVNVAPGNGHVVSVPLPDNVQLDKADYSLLMRYM